MTPRIKSAVAAGVIAVVSVIAVVASTHPLFHTKVPAWLGVLALPSLPGYAVVFFLGLGNGVHGIPLPTDVAPYILTFFLWWGMLYVALARHARRRSIARSSRSSLR